jgi:hypothetical protein
MPATITISEAKERLDSLINKARVDLYKPIQIAEVLYHSRIHNDIDIANLSTYQNPSLHWRDTVTKRLMGKVSTSSARYQHDIWSSTAMPTELLAILDAENKATQGAVEVYIYQKYGQRQGTVSDIIAYIQNSRPETFDLSDLLTRFVTQAGIRRSIDKAYEVVTYSLLETIVTSLKATVKISIPQESHALLAEFSDIARVLLGLDTGQFEWEQEAHLYRVGVTNAADRGLDMWANFGPAIQVKHLTLSATQANTIVDQVESDAIVLVCRDTEAQVIQTITQQIGWGRRVRGIITESDLIKWYTRCLHGDFASILAQPLLTQLLDNFKAEFPQNDTLTDFLEERGYTNQSPSAIWQVVE